ncbi:MAG TPA: type II secretion system F family protein [Caulobacteraceae bacterium]|nr:type II secretion system F family protein [Caulobacteraceae bacterium]
MHPADLMGPETAVLVLIFAAVFLAAQSASGLVRSGISRRAVNRRLATAERTGSLGELVLELRKQRGLMEDGQGRAGHLATLLLRSGIVYEPRKWIIYIIGMGLVTTVMVFAFTHKPLFAFPAGLLAAVGGPYVYLLFLAKRRAKLLGQQLPNALEIVVRSLEAGHPVPAAVALVGREMPDPIGSEFGMAADEIAYGATLEQAIGNVAARCKHDDFDLFAATIRLQERSGGNLVGLLKMNAHTIRERQKMRLKIHAASAEGRASAMILTSAPIAAFAFLEIARPNFYGEVIHARFIQVGLGGLGTWMFIGNLVMRKMIDMRI